MMTKREREQCEIASKFSSDVLAAVAIEQAKLGKLSEAKAYEIAGEYAKAAEVAYKLRTTLTESLT